MTTKLDPQAYFLYMTMTQAALKMHELGKSKEEFVQFSAEIWESMLLSDTDELFNTLQSAMMNDMKNMGWKKL
jgi:hypothetical protein